MCMKNKHAWLAVCLVLVGSVIVQSLAIEQRQDTILAQESTIASLTADVANLNQAIYEQEVMYTEREKVMTQEIEKLESEGVVVVSCLGYPLTRDELDLLARCCQSESGSTCFESQRKVLHVILNRVASDKFPDTITEVIYQKGQFDVVTYGAINTPATDETLENIMNELLFTEEVVPEDVLFFHATSIDDRINRVVWDRCEGTTFTY